MIMVHGILRHLRVPRLLAKIVNWREFNADEEKNIM